VSISSLFTPALLRTHSLFSLLFAKLAKSISVLSSQRRQVPVSYFFPRAQLSQPYVGTCHTSAFISRIFVEIGMLWLFHIFCSDAPIACPLFNLVRNFVVHSPSSVIRDPRYGNLSTCSSSLFWMSTRHAMPSLAITLVLSTLMSRLYLQLTRSRRSTNSCSSASEVASKMMSSA